MIVSSIISFQLVWLFELNSEHADCSSDRIFKMWSVKLISVLTLTSLASVRSLTVFKMSSEGEIIELRCPLTNRRDTCFWSLGGTTFSYVNFCLFLSNILDTYSVINLLFLVIRQWSAMNVFLKLRLISITLECGLAYQKMGKPPIIMWTYIWATK